MTSRAYTMRELLTKARERFGPDAARLKTREELVAALELEVSAPSEAEAQPPEALVVENFFLPPRR